MADEYEIQTYNQVQEIKNRKITQEIINNQMNNNSEILEESINNLSNQISNINNIGIDEVNEKIDSINTDLIEAQSQDILIKINKQEKDIKDIKNILEEILKNIMG